MQGRVVIVVKDWGAIRYGQNNLSNRAIEIIIKENTTFGNRCYLLEMHGFPGPMADVALNIIQKVVCIIRDVPRANSSRLGSSFGFKCFCITSDVVRQFIYKIFVIKQR